MLTKCWRGSPAAPARGGGGRDLLLTLALAAAGAGCAAPGGAPDRVEVVESPVVAIAGRALVAPVRVTGDPTAVGARLDDGREIPASLVWIRGRPTPGAAPAWLPDPGQWSAVEAGAPGAGEGVGIWAIHFDPPADGAGQALWLDGRRVALQWLASPAGERQPSALEAAEAPAPWPQLAPGGRRAAQLVWFEPEARSPLTRWRFTLISGGLGGDGRPAPPDRFEDDVVEALAQQMEDRWAIALHRLAGDDAGLARRFVQRLAAAVDFGDAIAPAFDPAGADTAALLADLLSADLTSEDRISRVDAWLRSLDAARAWVVDDAGAGGSGEAALAVIGLANLGSRPALGWARDAASAGAGEPIQLSPFTAQVIATPIPRRGSDGRPLRDLEVALGDDRMVLRAQDEPLPAEPPGLRLGPMLLDWTLQSWRAGSATAIAPGMPGATGALLRQSRADGGATVWSVYIEARRPARPGGVREQARLWLGPRGDPLAMIEIDPAAAEPRAGVLVTASEERWVAEVEIDPAWIEPGGRLRIGLERIDAAGRRSAWPRPMLPWQEEPGRALVDLESWGSLRQP